MITRIEEHARQSMATTYTESLVLASQKELDTVSEGPKPGHETGAISALGVIGGAISSGDLGALPHGRGSVPRSVVSRRPNSRCPDERRCPRPGAGYIPPSAGPPLPLRSLAATPSRPGS